MIGASHEFQQRGLNALDENGNEGCAFCGRPRDVHPVPVTAPEPPPGQAAYELPAIGLHPDDLAEGWIAARYEPDDSSAGVRYGREDMLAIHRAGWDHARALTAEALAAQERPATGPLALQLIIAVDALRDIADEPHPGFGPVRASKALDDIGTPGFGTAKPAPQPVPVGTAWRLLDEVRADRDDYAARLKAVDGSWAKLAAERDKLRELLEEVGVMAANAPEDDAFAVCEDIAMRVAAFGTVDGPRDAGLPAGGAHDPRTCGECQSMIAHGGHRIMDLMGHAAYTAYAAHCQIPPWSEVREAFAQAALAAAGGWGPCDTFDDWAEARGYANEHARDYGHADLLAAFEAGARSALTEAIALPVPYAPGDDGRHPDGCGCQFCQEDEREERARMDREELDDDTDNAIPDTEGDDW